MDLKDHHLVDMTSSHNYLVEEACSTCQVEGEEEIGTKEKILYILSSKTKCIFVLDVVRQNLILIHDYFSLRVSLEDLYKGKTSKLQLSKNMICSACKG